MDEQISVNELNVTAMVDESTDPYGMAGCSAIWARFEVSDATMVEHLRRSKAHGVKIDVRCGALVVAGVIGKLLQKGNVTLVSLAVHDIGRRISE
jgi:hypothetical protein